MNLLTIAIASAIAVVIALALGLPRVSPAQGLAPPSQAWCAALLAEMRGGTESRALVHAALKDARAQLGALPKYHEPIAPPLVTSFEHDDLRRAKVRGLDLDVTRSVNERLRRLEDDFTAAQSSIELTFANLIVGREDILRFHERVRGESAKLNQTVAAQIKVRYPYVRPERVMRYSFGTLGVVGPVIAINLSLPGLLQTGDIVFWGSDVLLAMIAFKSLDTFVDAIDFARSAWTAETRAQFENRRAYEELVGSELRQTKSVERFLARGPPPETRAFSLRSNMRLLSLTGYAELRRAVAEGRAPAPAILLERSAETRASGRPYLQVWTDHVFFQDGVTGEPKLLNFIRFRAPSDSGDLPRRSGSAPVKVDEGAGRRVLQPAPAYGRARVR